MHIVNLVGSVLRSHDLQFSYTNVLLHCRYIILKPDVIPLTVSSDKGMNSGTGGFCVKANVLIEIGGHVCLCYISNTYN
jgi:hypothetical protein